MKELASLGYAEPIPIPRSIFTVLFLLFWNFRFIPQEKKLFILIATCFPNVHFYSSQREMMGDPLLNNYSVIILDEVKEMIKTFRQVGRYLPNFLFFMNINTFSNFEKFFFSILWFQVHERTAQIDIIMGLLKKILKR